MYVLKPYRIRRKCQSAWWLIGCEALVAWHNFGQQWGPKHQAMPPNDDRPIGTNYEEKGSKPERGRFSYLVFECVSLKINKSC